MTNKELPINKMPEEVQIEILVKSMLQNSDYILYGNDSLRIQERLEAFKRKNNGIMSPDHVQKIIKTEEQLKDAMSSYVAGHWPDWLQSFIYAHATGLIKLKGGAIRKPKWASEHDVVGMYEELKNIGFKNINIERAIAKHLDVNGWEDDNKGTGRTRGSETVRDHVFHMKKVAKF